MKYLKKFNETLLTLRKKVEVPEKDIQDVITAVKEWFDKNPEKKICRPSIFGHHIWEINRNTIEEDIRKGAEQAFPYKKVDEGQYNGRVEDGLLTVSDLIDKLSKYDGDTKVAVSVSEEFSEIFCIEDRKVSDCQGRGDGLNTTDWDPNEKIIVITGNHW